MGNEFMVSIQFLLDAYTDKTEIAVNVGLLVGILPEETKIQTDAWSD